VTLIPNHFLFRLAHACRHVAKIPHEKGDSLLDLPESCRIEDFGAMDGRRHFADVRMAWNEFGVAFQVEVRGKEQAPRGDAARPRSSDGVSLWIDTRDARTSHRASRYCHQFHVLPVGGGPDNDEPVFVQTKINRALADAPICAADAVPFRVTNLKRGYLLELFLPAAVLHGFDPEQNPRLGFYYSVRDAEHGEQTLGLGPDFPFWEDPSLWSVLRLEGR
jgi:hypothetical protein